MKKSKIVKKRWIIIGKQITIPERIRWLAYGICFGWFLSMLTAMILYYFFR